MEQTKTIRINNYCTTVNKFILNTIKRHNQLSSIHEEMLFGKDNQYIDKTSSEL